MTRETADPQRPPVVAAVADVRARIARARAAGRSIALVPTMGALHAGHASLLKAAAQGGAFVVASIYVNPTQFGPAEDFHNYPRTLERDLDVCRETGVDLVFAPPHSEMYAENDQTRIRVGALAETLCGPHRPGHFEGVCTVVAKLFCIVAPDVAYFGRKDAQQAVVIRRMVRDLHIPARIEVCPIVREPDGLAMSSRNARLSAEDRAKALALYQALKTGEWLLHQGETSAGKTIAAMRAVLAAHSDLKVDYLSIVNPDTLEDVDPPRGDCMIAGAIRIGDVRLIDNLIVNVTG